MEDAIEYHEPSRFSLVRFLIVIAVMGGIVFGVGRWSMSMVAEARAEPAATWFAPYVDVTLTPTLHFEDASEQPSDDVVLAFIVASPANACEPSWGTYYDLDAAARALDLDRRVVRLRERGGDVIVSFGGAVNDELATSCTDATKLAAAYQSVIDRYHLTAIDFDIEGAAISDASANARRVAAIQKLKADNKDLDVWFTLPVDPNGLRPESVALIDGVLGAGIDLAGVNVMTMNYGGSRAQGVSMKDANVAALTATWQQLDSAYRRAGKEPTEQDIWSHMGITPMIGLNDVPGDTFTTGDADQLVKFAKTVNVGRLSFWSANRDIQCGAVVDDDRVSNTCSGVKQQPLQFSKIFADAAPQHRSNTEPLTVASSRDNATSRDDPRSSPYPLWRTSKSYEEGAKVVWQGRVYQAKWWTEGDQPDAPVKQVWETPWRYLGPVLDSDREAVLGETKTVDGVRPKWAAEKVYVAGDQVELDSHVFQAKWWTQGDRPEEDPDQPYDHPWQYIGEVKK